MRANWKAAAISSPHFTEDVAKLERVRLNALTRGKPVKVGAADSALQKHFQIGVREGKHGELHAWCRQQMGDDMYESLKRFLAFAAIITVINGISYALVPSALLPTYGVESGSGAVLGFRFFGLQRC